MKYFSSQRVIKLTNRIVSIVDDETDITTLFHDALQNIPGIAVFTFNDPILALEHFQMNEFAYVLVLSDLRMPGLSGMEFLKKVKNSNRFVRTILMTAFSIDDKIFEEYTRKKIINACIQKPIKIPNLIDEVNTQLHSYEMQEISTNKMRFYLIYKKHFC